MTQYSIPAHVALGVLNDARAIVGTFEEVLRSANKSKSGRYFSESREGAVIKINPTFDVNQARADLKTMREDMVRIQDSLFYFNSAIHLGPDVLTSPSVSLALRKIQEESKLAGKIVVEMSNNVSRLHLEGDDVVDVNIGELMDEYINHVANKRQLKTGIAKANNSTVTFNVESPILQNLLDSL